LARKGKAIEAKVIIVVAGLSHFLVGIVTV
jgi:hypothetical protein